MSFKRLESHLINVMKEAQIKLGYDKGFLRMNYTVQSLGHLLGDKKPINELLQEFSEYACNRLGKIEFSSNEEGIVTFIIPPQGVEYVHNNIESGEFLCEFIEEIRNHCTDFDRLVRIFKKHSDRVHIEEIQTDEFNYLVYFEDGVPDEFYYCINTEDLHITYHRFIKEDYLDFEF